MQSPISMPRMRHACLLSSLALFAAGAAGAQSSLSSNEPADNAAASTTAAPSESSSSSFQLATTDGANAAAALNAGVTSFAEGAGGAAAGQPDYGHHHGLFSNLAFEAGGGANAPIGNDSPYITWGGNFTVGAGKHFGHGISLLGEYQFMDNKLPGSLIAEVGTQGGYTHIWSITADPVIDLMPKRATSAYVTGGFGFYHKTTNFTVPVEGEECYYYCGIVVENESVFGFNSRQWGGNLGLGISHRLGGTYGDGQAKLFAEARYLFIDTPSVNANNGTGTTELIPITLGVRW